MSEGHPPARHSLGLRLLHWATALLVLVQVLLAALNRLLYEPRPVLAEWLVQAHLSCGAALLAVVLVRLGIRLFARRAIAPPVHTGLPWLVTATHTALYGGLLALPILGYVRLAALGFEIELFGLLSLPPMLGDPPLARAAATAHTTLATLLGGLVTLHVAGATLHRRLFGTPVLQRMGIKLGGAAHQA
ncbi:MAG: cytochrome b/b6 domain-containing protein [Pseudomonadota bacterium]